MCCQRLTGWEDIPVGVRAILVGPGQGVDLLSHIAIRARSQKVLLTCCSDLAVWETDVVGHFSDEGIRMSVSVDTKGEVHIKKTTDAVDSRAPQSSEQPLLSGHDSPLSASTTTSSPSSPVSKTRRGPPKRVIPSAEFEEHKQFVGGKSLNLTRLKPAETSAAALFKVPSSVAVPFGVFEMELKSENNKDMRETYEKLEKKLDGSEENESVLAAIRTLIVEEMCVSSELEAAIVADLTLTGMMEGVDKAQLIQTVKRVWASKWNDRATSNRRANKILDDSLLMGVLLQNLVQADYSFVIHTSNPLAESPHMESLIEVVVGLGEPLVSNAPGSPLSAVALADSTERPTISVARFPSKDTALLAQHNAIMCRSDSNGEDLPEFAGAGLYDSYPTTACHHSPADYSEERLVFDNGFREDLLHRLYLVGQAVLKQSGSETPQDIEGCVKGNEIYVVQTRAQV